MDRRHPHRTGCAAAGLPAAVLLLAVALAPATIAPATPPGAGASPASAATTGTANPAEALLDRLDEALGGRAVLDAIESSRVEFTIRRGEDDPDPIRATVISAAPDRVRMRQHGGGRPEWELGFDGSVGWMSDGRGGVLPLDRETALLMTRGADLQALPRSLRSRFAGLDLGRPGRFEGRAAEVLLASDGEGGISRIHIDPTTALPIAIETIDEGPAGEERRTIRFEGWRREGAALVFSRAEIDAGGVRSTVLFERVAFGGIDLAEFTPPVGVRPETTTP